MGGSDSFIVIFMYTWEKNSSLMIAKGEETLNISKAQWRPFKYENKFNPNNTVNLDELPLIFVGYGIDAPEHEWNDYADLDVTGKVVVVMRRKPESVESMDHATFNTKAAVAERNGALGMIVFTDPNIQMTVERGRRFPPRLSVSVEEDDEMRNQFRRVIESSSAFASVQIDPQIIDSLFPNHSLQDIQEALDKGTSPAEFVIAESTVSMGWSESDKVETKEVPNVVGQKNRLCHCRGTLRSFGCF